MSVKHRAEWVNWCFWRITASSWTAIYSVWYILIRDYTELFVITISICSFAICLFQLNCCKMLALALTPGCIGSLGTYSDIDGSLLSSFEAIYKIPWAHIIKVFNWLIIFQYEIFNNFFECKKFCFSWRHLRR